MGAEWARQRGFGIRTEWGRSGAAAIGADAACVVVIDVLSFTTTVSVATAAGTAVFPYRWRDDSARDFAESRDAALAVGRRAAGAGQPWSLSPAAIRRAPFTERLVLPSPNGSAIAAAVAGPATVVAACLRNRRTVADWLMAQGWGTPEHPIAIVPAGEHWPGAEVAGRGDGRSGSDEAGTGARPVRPALEDWLGAGALAAALLDRGAAHPSPESRSAAATFTAMSNPAALIADCASGRELATIGFTEDVTLATELDADTTVPVLTDGAFIDLATRPRRP
ncbi:2-phosphosulfolactate phosphatase [Nocardia asteroides]|uniref:2-phosphosulfolactate phosphatase n=1 Tax=Nocardia asteroides TaxID=1824 RepID=UPI003798F476